MQVWMGKDKTQVGDLVDGKLYRAMYNLLSDVCPVDSIRRVCHKSPFASVRSACMNVAGQHRPCDFVITKIDAEWATDAIRQYLIAAVAYALKAATAQDVSNTDGNCWSSGILTKVCNVGDVVRVNFPELPEGRANYMHVTFANLFTGYGSYECCGEGIRGRLDNYIDTLHGRMKLEFPKQADNAWFRDSRCIINGEATCPDGAGNN